MYGYIVFAEDYLHVILAICRGLKAQVEDLEFRGVSVRRSTVCAKVDAVAKELDIKSCEWLNSVETRIMAEPYDPEAVARCRERFGSERLRFIMISDRDLAQGYVSGAKLCSNRLAEMVAKDDRKRWSYIAGLLDYYTRLFESKRPDFIFMNEVTFAWETALYVAAEKMGIPCFSLAYLRGCGRYCMSDDVYGMIAMRDKLYRASLENPALLNGFLDKASERIASFRSTPTGPDYMKSHKASFATQTRLPWILGRLSRDVAMIAATKLGFFGTKGLVRANHRFDWLKFGYGMFAEGRRALAGEWFEDANEHLNSDYIFYPLHYEPESSTSVACHLFTNQIAVIEQISKSMPFGCKLLVKEHLPSVGLRPSGFYDRIRRIPDVHLITPFENTFRLLRNAKLVVVLTGTSGWEALLLGIPLLVFGHAEYMGLGAGFLQHSQSASLADEIVAAMKVPPASETQLKHFLAAQLAVATDLSFIGLFKGNSPNCQEKGEIYGPQLARQILSIVEERKAAGARAPQPELQPPR